MRAAESSPAYFELRFSPDSKLIPVVRQFVSSFYKQLIGHDDMAARMALAAHELLENAAKFSLDGLSSLHISVAAGGPGPGREREVVLRTLNRADEQHVAAARTLVTEMAQHEAGAYYQLLMQRNAQRRGGGLGLARIYAEAEMTLGCSVQDDHLLIEARARVPGEGQPW